MTVSKHATAQVLVAILQLAIGTVPAYAAAQPGRVLITPAHMTAVLVSSGLHVTADQVEPLSPVTAAESNPRLKAANVEPLDANTTKIRMQCERTAVCLPFYVLIHWQDPDKALQALTRLPNDAPAKSHRTRAEDLLVRNGKNATLIFEGPNLRMTLPVLCLQNGARGQHVRVISQDRKKIFLARVTGPGIVTSAVLNQ